MKRYTSKENKEFVSKPLFDEEVLFNKDPLYPKISIVTPSYNQAQFLERTILSVLNQNYPNLEYIIIDDGSTDRSVEIIKKYEKYLAYWERQPNSGQANAVRKGFEISTGDILAYLNSDDTYLPGTFFKVAEAFRKNNDADLIFGNVFLIDKNDKRIGELRFTKFEFDTLIYEGGNLHQTGAFWTKKIYKSVGSINPHLEYCLDYDFFCKVAEKGKLVHIKNHLANFRIHKAAKSYTIRHIARREHEEIMNRYIPENASKWYLKYKKSICTTRRIARYVTQGDLDYILRGAKKRIVKLSGDYDGT